MADPRQEWESAKPIALQSEWDQAKPIGGTGPNLGVPGGLAETALATGTGMLGSIAGGWAGLAQGAKNLVSEGMPAADRVRQVQEALSYQPRTVLGQKLTGAVSYPFEKLAQGADVAGGKVTDVTGSPLLGAAANTTIQAAPMALPLARGPVGRMVGKEQAALDTARSLNVARDAAMQWAKSEGFKISPAEANPTLLNRVLEGFSNQSKVQTLISTKNQPMADALTRKALGFSPDTPISVESLTELRKTAGKPYEAVRKLGRIETDSAYKTTLDNITSKYTGAEKDFPGMAQSEVRSAVDAARREGFDASAGVDAIKIQRSAADKAFRQGDIELGKAHKAIAEAIEEQIDRHITMAEIKAPGTTPQIALDMDQIKNFRKARELIARSYDVQQALKGGEHVDLRVLAAQLRKGRPLGGGLKEAADFANRFPGSTQTGKVNAYVPGFWDFGMGGLGGFAAHTVLGSGIGPAAGVGALAALTRPGIRGLLASDPYQSAFVHPPGYSLGTGLTLADILTRSPVPGMLMSGETAARNRR